MKTSYPTSAGLAGPARKVSAPPRGSRPAPVDGSWRYHSGGRSRTILALSVLFSVGVHVGVLFGIGRAKKKPAPPPPAETLTLNFVIPDMKDLEEPDPEPSLDEPLNLEDLGALVPMQADVPQVPTASDFVQTLDFASLVERPDLSNAKVVTIPEHIGRGGKGGENLGKIFDLSELDRQPQAIVQPPPRYPDAMKADNRRATVRVEFIVTADGRTANVRVVDSTDSRFDDAAVVGVGRWKFKPGVKTGRKVNTRMLAPIIFNVQ